MDIRQSPLVAARMMSAKKTQEHRQLKWLGFNRGRITRAQGLRQSKKLMLLIKEIYPA
jgi:hypothetical protein